MWSIWVCATVVSAEALGIWIYWTSRARKTASEPLNAFFVESANGVVSLVRLSAAAAMAWEENSSGVNLNARLGALEVTWMTVLLFLFYVVIILSELSTYWHSHGGGGGLVITSMSVLRYAVRCAVRWGLSGPATIWSQYWAWVADSLWSHHNQRMIRHVSLPCVCRTWRLRCVERLC